MAQRAPHADVYETNRRWVSLAGGRRIPGWIHRASGRRPEGDFPNSGAVCPRSSFGSIRWTSSGHPGGPRQSRRRRPQHWPRTSANRFGHRRPVAHRWDPIQSRPLTLGDVDLRTSVTSVPTVSSSASALPTPIRSQVRAAVERAWGRAESSGALPALGSRDAAARRPGRAPGRTRARRLRQQPRAAAGAAVPHGAAGDCHGARRRAGGRGGRRRERHPDRRGRGRATRVPQHAPARRRAGGDGRCDPRRPTGLGSRRHASAALGQRRVRVGQPDRAAPCRQRPGRVHRRPAQSRPRGGRPARDARVLLQRRRRPDPQPRRVDRGHPAGRARARGRLPRRLRPRPRDRAARRRLGRCHRARSRHERDPRPLGRRPGPRGHRAEPGRPRRPLRCLEDRGLAPRRRLGRARDRAAARGRPRLRTGRRALVPLDRVRRRQGPGDHPLERPADVLRLRHRLRDREVQPRLRPPDLHLGRGPPRHGRARAQRGPGDGLRPEPPSRCTSTRGFASSATARRSR